MSAGWGFFSSSFSNDARRSRKKNPPGSGGGRLEYPRGTDLIFIPVRGHAARTGCETSVRHYTPRATRRVALLSGRSISLFLSLSQLLSLSFPFPLSWRLFLYSTASRLSASKTASLHSLLRPLFASLKREPTCTVSLTEGRGVVNSGRRFVPL